MDTRAATPENNAGRKELKSESSPTRLHGHLLLIIRFFYIAFFVHLVILFLIGFPMWFEQLGAGIPGVQLAYDSHGEIVLSPSPSLAAAKAGVQPGDVLLAIDGTIVPAWSRLNQTDMRLKGPVGTPVILDVRTNGGSIRQYSVVREGVNVTQVGFAVNMLDAFFILGFFIIALVVFLRKSDDGFAVLASIALLCVATTNSQTYIFFGVLHPEWIGVMMFMNRLSVFGALCTFPTGEFIPRWTRKLIPLIVVYGLLSLLPLPYNPSAWPVVYERILNLGFYAAGFGAQIYRYRRSSNYQEQLQIKWVVFSLAISYLVSYGMILVYQLSPTVNNPTQEGLVLQLLGILFRYLAFLAVPVSLAIAILRFHLYDINFILNKTLVYGSLTAILSGIYTALITLSQKLFIALTGEKSDTAIVLTTLVVAASFTPVKTALQTIVDKRFKEEPDPTKKLKALGDQIRNRMFAIDITHGTRRLLEEAVAAFGAKSGATFTPSSGNEPVHTIGDWDNDGRLNIVIQNTTRFGMLSLGMRKNGLEYTPQDQRALQEIAQEMAVAIEQDCQTPAKSYHLEEIAAKAVMPS